MEAPDPNRPRIVAAIPAYKEEKTIGSIVLLARKFVDEVVVVDDGSSDNTAWIAELAGARLIRHNGNHGYGAALRTSFAYARETDADILVILDADGQHRAELIPVVVGPVLDGGVDVCIGSRFLEEDGNRNIPRHRRLGIRAVTRLANLRLNGSGPLRDAQSGFRAYSRAAIRAIDPKDPDMGASVEILWRADEAGLRMREVPIHVDYPPRSTHRNPIGHGLAVVGSMIRYVAHDRLARVLAVPSMIAILGGLTLSAYAILESAHAYRLNGFTFGLSLGLVAVGLVLGYAAFSRRARPETGHHAP